MLSNARQWRRKDKSAMTRKALEVLEQLRNRIERNYFVQEQLAMKWKGAD